MESQPIANSPETAPINSAPIIQPSTPVQTKTSLVVPILLTALICAVVFGLGGYFLGRSFLSNSQGDTIQSTPITTESSEKLLPTNSPSQTPAVSSFGSSDISFADNGSEIYLKHTVNLIDSKVEFPNSKERTLTKVYSYDESFEPKELTNIDLAKYKWINLIEEGINDSVGSKNILISDRLFSFKKVPDSTSFVFVVEWDRSAGQNQGSWSPYEAGRELFYYDRSNGLGKLNKIAAFTNDKAKMTYPKIDTFSQDSRYVSLQLFGCWNCGGHQPETLLLDLKTLKTKNIGKVVQFSWGQNGGYQYKDYVVVACKEPQPGECTQDQNILPVKTGQF